MSASAGSSVGRPSPLRILHILRAPLGGLFRHVLDLARGQTERGHSVGIVADSRSVSTGAEQALAALAPSLALGVTRIAMSRHIGPSDVSATRQVRTLARKLGCDVVHGHGAKGGAYARLGAPPGALRVYTPHGGSLHYTRQSPIGLMYLTLEQLLMPRTDLFLFESAYGRRIFAERIGEPGARARVVHNGVRPEEFAPVPPLADATDLLFIGELRLLKGVDVLIDALKLLGERGRALDATVVGQGPDAEAFRARATQARLADRVHFVGPLPARAAFARGRLLVIPSRAESLPYIVLEAAAAGVPMLATNVGGIGEIFDPDAAALIEPGSPDALAEAIAAAIGDPPSLSARTERLRQRVRAHFSADGMVEAVLNAYAESRSAAGTPRR